MVPLYVDLDGTLTPSDVLIESIFALLRKNPLMIFVFPMWLLSGKAHFKRQIAGRVDLDVSHLPFTQDLIDFLRTERSEGRRLVLITASDQKYADSVAQQVGLFERAIGSDGSCNLSATRKLNRIQADCENAEFDYAGNSVDDLEIWPHSRRAIVVSPFQRVIDKAKACSNVTRIFNTGPVSILNVAGALRVHQWVKNLLLFLPLLFAHRIGEMGLFVQALMGFVSFSLCSSSVYLLNDLLDLNQDRAHSTKRNRPLAAGTFPINVAVVLVPSLLIGSIVVGLFLPIEFIALLVIYYAMAVTYSLKLKQIVLLDVLVLTALYTIRLLAGGAAVGVEVSHWLLVFSLFFFLSLGMVKRYTEIRMLKVTQPQNIAGRGYHTGDEGLIARFGTSNGCLAVLVLALYINSEQIRLSYQRPELIWLLCPIMLYWIGRIWLLAERDQLHDDPVLFAVKDRVSHGLILLAMFILWLAS